MQVTASTEPGDLAARIAAVITEAGAPAVAEAALARLSADQKTELLNKAIAASPKPENSKPDTYGGVADRERGGAKQSAPAQVKQRLSWLGVPFCGPLKDVQGQLLQRQAPPRL